MEKQFAIVTDIVCDLGPKLREEYEIDYLPGHYTVSDGADRISHLEWKGEERSEFFSKLRKNPAAFTTSPSNVEEWKIKYEEYLKEGRDVLAIALSSSLSATCGLMEKAAKEISEVYKDNKVIVVDSRRFGAGIGIMAIYASLLRKEGKSIDETVDWLNANLNRFHQAGWLDDLSFVAKKGRISSAKAFFGTLVGVKPIGEFDKNGMTTVLGKAKGEKQAYAVLLDYIGKTIENPSEQIILVSTGDRLKQAEAYVEMIKERFHPKAVYLDFVYPSSGINVGPGLMSAYYLGRPISEDLAEEKALFNQLLMSK